MLKWTCNYCGKIKPSEKFAWIRGKTFCCKICDAKPAPKYGEIERARYGVTRQRLHQLRTGYNTRYPGIDVNEIILRDKSRCHLCRKFVRPSERSLDHVIPRSRGGATSMENLKLAHSRCNSRKGARLVLSGTL